MFQTNVVGKSKQKFYVQIFIFKNRAIYEIMWRNVVDPDMPQMTIICNRKYSIQFECPITEVGIQTNIIFGTYYFSTATMVTRTRHNVRFYVHCLFC